MAGYSKLDVSPIAIGFHESLNWGVRDGESRAEEDTEAPDSDDAESTGGCSWKEFEVE
jgi:hypothetical protein